MRQGKPEDALDFQSDVPVLSPTEGEVLVKIKSAALNPVGYKLMKLIPDAVAKRPLTAEYDFSGVVVDQKNTAKFKVGDEVYGQINAAPNGTVKSQGALAQYITIDAAQVAHKPASISFDEAAGLSLVCRTAIDALIDIANIKPGQNVFINGGSSAVGTMAIQIAKAYGCTVTASCSGKNIELVKKLGADEVIDYTVSPPEERFVKHPPSPQFDVVFDAVSTGTKLFTHCESYLKPGGIFISTGPAAGAELSWSKAPILAAGLAQTYLQPSWLGGIKRTHKVCLDRPDGRAVPVMEKLVDEGKVKPVIDSTFSFSHVNKAYEKMMGGHAAGKVIVKIEE